MSKEFSIGVIISTYNNPKWLEKTLWGYLCQTCMPQEIIIADDGSSKETQELIESFTGRLPIVHVWHEDSGFRKTRILNLALMQATADYLIFTDQDCIPREDFVETHRRFAKGGHFLSGGYFRLTMPVSESITREHINMGTAFQMKWLKKQGQPINFKWTKLIRNKFFSAFMNAITPARASWNGCNASGWREDMLAVNGFDEEMQYGGEDREFGIRLINKGVKPVQIRYSAIVLHLDHKRPYRIKEIMEKNRSVMRSSKKTKLVVTPHGIAQHVLSLMMICKYIIIK